MDKKIKTAAGKVPLQLIPLRALFGMARVRAYGDEKYAPGNWYMADDRDLAARYVGAALRHIEQMQHPCGLYTLESAAALDPESELPTIDHAICSLIMLRGLLIKLGMMPADPKGGV